MILFKHKSVSYAFGRLLTASLFLLCLSLAGQAGAYTIHPDHVVDYDTFGAQGAALFSESQETEMVDKDGIVFAVLSGQVFFNEENDLYTYVYSLDPTTAVSNISAFSLEGLAGYVEGMAAGFSFGDVQRVSSLEEDELNMAFLIEVDPEEGKMDWRSSGAYPSWPDWEWDGAVDEADAITFFFQSTLAPGTSAGLFTLTNCTTNGSACNYAPAPEPVTLVLVGCGLMGLAVLGRRRVRPS
jgi:hypothetical protein